MYNKISDFVFLSVSLIYLYETILSAIDIDNFGCLEPFLPLSDNFLIWRFLGLICKVYLTQRPKLNKKNCILHEFPLPLAKIVAVCCGFNFDDGSGPGVIQVLPKGRIPLQNWMNFRKNFNRPLTPPL